MSVDQVLSLQRTKFATKLPHADLDAQTATALRQLSTQLEDFIRDIDKQSIVISASKISTDLKKLSNHASYTSRPALTELFNQFTVISSSQEEVGINDSYFRESARKLLAARTYSALASEIETMKFQL